MHPLLRYLVIATPCCVGLFLWLAGFFTQWDGSAVSRRPSTTDRPAVHAVLIVTADGEATEVDWPADLVDELALRVDPTGIPPSKVPENAVPTRKFFGSLSFDVGPAAERREITPNLALPLSSAVLAFFLGLGLFNMARSGSPFSWEAREIGLPPPLDGHLQSRSPDAGASAAARARPGPPPPRRRRGQGRRR